MGKEEIAMTETSATVEHNGAKVAITVAEVSLEDLLPLIEQALRGCGYFFEGSLDIVKED